MGNVRSGNALLALDPLLGNLHPPRSFLLAPVRAFCDVQRMGAARCREVLREYQPHSSGEREYGSTSSGMLVRIQTTLPVSKHHAAILCIAFFKMVG